MSNIQDPDHFLCDSLLNTNILVDHFRDEIIELLMNYGNHVRDTTLNWAADNAEVFNNSEVICGDPFANYFDVQKDSILKGKTHPDLNI